MKDFWIQMVMLEEHNCSGYRPSADLGSVRRWSSPAGRSSLLLRRIFWTNWWDAHLATMLASGRISKVSSMWRAHVVPPLQGQVWQRALLILHKNESGEAAQIIHRWSWSVTSQRLQWLKLSPSWNYVLLRFLMLTHSLRLWFSLLCLCDFPLTEMCSHPCMLPHRPISVQAGSQLVSEASRFSLTCFALSLWSRISYLFHTCSTSLSVHAG